MRKLFILFLCSLFCVGTIYAQPGESFHWEIWDDVLYIEGDNELPDYELIHNSWGAFASNAPWFELRSTFSRVKIGDEITAIGKNAFYGCSGLTSVSIGERVVSIGESAFTLCSLTSVVIPTSVTDIGNRAFESCSSLSEIICLPSYPPTINPGMFDESIFTTCILKVPADLVTSYRNATEWGYFENIEAIPEGSAGPLSWKIIQGVLYISGVGDMPDYNHAIGELEPWREHISLITRVEIGNGVTSISDYAFISHSKLASISIPNTVTTIGARVFDLCSSLTSITIPSSVTSIGTPTFLGAGLISILVDPANPNYSSADNALFNKDLTTIIECPSGKTGDYVIPSTVKTIGAYSFSQSYINSISIPASVTTIEGYAFCSAFNLTSIFIPSSVTSISNTSLIQCNKMISISVDANNPKYTSDDGVLFNNDMTTLLVFPRGRSGHYDIPESVETIGDRSFETCILSSVTIPESVTNIDDLALSNLTNITSITIPSSVTRIGNYALQGCTGLKSITVPASVITIGEYAFAECIGLTEVINPSVTPQVISANVFDELNFNDCILRVPAASVDLYRKAEGWKEFKNIVSLEAELTLDTEEIYLLRGASMTMTVNGGEQSIPHIVTWVSENAAVADVDQAGTITAVSPGKTTITASDGITLASCDVTVIDQGTSSIEGTIDYTTTETVIVKIYINPAFISSQLKGKVVGGYVLLATTVPNDQGKYHFDNLPEGHYQIEVVFGDLEPEATAEISLLDDTSLTDVNFFIDPDLGVIIDVPTDAKELLMPLLKIYPNPFTDVVRIAGADATSGQHALTMRVINAAGVTVYTQTITNFDASIHLGHLPTGMYIIHMEIGRKATSVKIVKQ